MVKFLIMDVDGTLTDGKIYMGSNGELFKAFSIKDGCGIKDILPQYGIIPIIITARESIILSNRCKELGIIHLHQNVRDKLVKLTEIITEYNQTHSTMLSLADCAYIGDDILDVQSMKSIKESGGIVGCPKDAINQVKELSDFVSEYTGGSGAVRDFIDWIGELIQQERPNDRV